jgi:hypothetical protein
MDYGELLFRETLVYVPCEGSRWKRQSLRALKRLRFIENVLEEVRLEDNRSSPIGSRIYWYESHRLI